MDQKISDADRAFLEMFPDTSGPTLPMPRFGKIPPAAEQPQALPTSQAEAKAFNLSWVDEEELGIRVFVTAAPGPEGIEINVSVQGTRPDLSGISVHVSITGAAYGRDHASCTITLDDWIDDKRGCTGKGSFGTADQLRKYLGDKVALDLYLIDFREYLGGAKLREN